MKLATKHQFAVVELALALLAAGAPCSRGQDILPDGTQAARRAMTAVRVPEGMEFELFACEPAVASPVAICMDEQGRVYVAEQYRFNRGCEENRTRDFLLEGDLQITSVEERLELFRKFAHRFEGGMDWFTKVSDQVRILEDRDGDGRADFTKVFAPGFNHPAAGMAAGILARDGNIYFTCIPHLWLLKDTDGNHQADVREVLHYGFGVNLGYLGHDFHGLIWGPDGRLYFSVGDRGYSVVTQEGERLVGPRQGAVFRCEADGSHFEVVHVGFRNPQELAFDEFGNLFTGDNNADRGDLSRFIYVVEGGHSGWNMAYQSLTDPYLLGPWHAEKMWLREPPEQPAWILPPVGYLGAGPAGLVSYPGTGLDKSYDGCFFMANWTGNGGIETLRVEPDGARFRLVEYADFLKPIRTSDVEFGYDGKMYISDFPSLNWDTGESAGGRIYTLTDPASQTEAVEEMTRLFRDGFDTLATDELTALFDHADMRVRLRAQFTVADRDELEAVRQLALSETAPPRTRRHAIWALWQIARRNPRALEPLRHLMTARQADVQEQALRVLADLGDPSSAETFVALLGDSRPRVRFFAAMALGKTEHAAGTGAVVRMLEENADQDPYLRHAGVQALSGLCDDETILTLGASDNESVRLAALLVLRLRESPEIARLLEDDSLRLVTEAARAINDLPIDEATPRLAAVVDRLMHHGSLSAGDSDQGADSGREHDSGTELPEPLVRRVINANFRVGAAENAAALLQLARSDHLSETMRREAIDCLADWTAPEPRDRVTGFWRPLEPRDGEVVRQAIQAQADELLRATDGPLLASAIGLLTRYDIAVDDEQIASWARDPQRPAGTRIESLKLLVKRRSDPADDVLDAFLSSDDGVLRAAGREQLARIDPAAAIRSIRRSLESERTAADELQSAFTVLSKIKSEEADRPIAEALAWLIDEPESPPIAWRHARSVELDVLAAAENRNSTDIAELLEAYERRTREESKRDPLAEFRATLYGGDAERGGRIFRIHRAGQCMRCHKANGEGGDAGPDLSQVASRANRDHLLESLIEPDAKIAPGFGTVTLLTYEGRIISGVVQDEDEEHTRLKTGEGRVVTVKRSDIEERVAARSPMPQYRVSLKKREMRDLIEFLSTQK